MVKLHGAFEQSHGGQEVDLGSILADPSNAAISGKSLDNFGDEQAEIAIVAAANGKLPTDVMVAVDKGIVQDGGRVGHEKDMTPKQLQDVIRNGTGREAPTTPGFG